MTDEDIWELKGVDVPAGLVYQWNVIAVRGEEVNPHALAEYTDAGWYEVPAGRHGDFPVIHGGCRLMQRQKSACDDANREAWDASRQQQIDCALGKGLERFCPPGFRMLTREELRTTLPHRLSDDGQWEPTNG